MIIPFLGWIIIRKQPTRYNIAAAILCVTGVGCVAYAGIGEFSLRFGDFITLASALWLSFHVLYTAKYAPGRSMMLLTVIQFIVAGLLGLITGLITEPGTQLQPVGRRHLDEPHLHHRVCLLCGPRIAKRRCGPR